MRKVLLIGGVLVLALVLAAMIGAQEATPEPPMGMMGGAGMAEMMQPMMDMMGQMAGAEMSAEMRAGMEQMRGMMAMMAGSGMMGRMDTTDALQMMMGMMDEMMGMDMTADMQAQMQELRGMMDEMMGMSHEGELPGEMGGMEMDTGYSVDDLAPLALAFHNGGDVYFIHPEASDEGVAQVLTEMMGTAVITVPSLGEVAQDLLGNVYVFTNGLTAMGPLGFQPDVFDTVPGDEGYTPLRSVNLVTWQEGVPARELRSADEVLAAEAAGELVIERPGVVVNMPVLVWPEGQR